MTRSVSLVLLLSGSRSVVEVELGHTLDVSEYSEFGVVGGVSLLTDCGDLFVEEGVEERRLACVGGTNDADLERSGIFGTDDGVSLGVDHLRADLLKWSEINDRRLVADNV